MGDSKLKTEVAKVSVVLFSTGEVTVHGPLHDKVLCLGLLRVGEDVVLRHRMDRGGIIVPEFVSPVGVKDS